ncbi:hypothetical protein ARALYDRAFT_319165 [Arabidopsis lyrata subsp. lyrata]|uniref:Uncharacterized protein n=1 Tax=Arabidopsis lyrata subsp. lyrata TaxID=81972 RepID=D7L561_ARALL|nr:hypothetical protein ARALYDRAFT_319165 [Arabidopsis lyrata subsp. lyrata]
MKMYPKSDSDITSLDLSSPKLPTYYVQSPSRDSDKSSSVALTTHQTTPTESPSHPSFASRVSNNGGGGFRWKGRRKYHGGRWWPADKEDDADDGRYEDLYEDNRGVSIVTCRLILGVVATLSIFFLLCSVLFGVSQSFPPIVYIKGVNVQSFYYGEGSDSTGVPTKIMNFKCSVDITTHNPSTLFGIHVSSTTINLVYSRQFTLAIAQLKSYYQPKLSNHTSRINLVGSKVPLYGAGAELVASDHIGGVPVHTPNYTILSESRLSSSSRTSNGTSGMGFRWKGSSRRSNMYWPEKPYTINEDEVYDDNRGLSVGQCRAVLVILGTVVVFSVFCSVLWGASHPFSPIVSVKSFNIHSFYYGEGIDRTGVATKILSFNSSVKVTIDSPAPYFGIHVSSSTFKLTFSALTLATGQLKSYYQPRKSKHIAIVKLTGAEVPLYGAGPHLAASDKKGKVPVKLEFEIRSRGNLLGKLVKSKHVNHVSCSFFISSSKTSKPIEFSHKTCKLVTK